MTLTSDPPHTPEPEARRLLLLLDQAQSTYCTAFTATVREVYEARLEANDNLKYLRTLTKWFNLLIEQVRCGAMVLGRARSRGHTTHVLILPYARFPSPRSERSVFCSRHRSHTTSMQLS